MIRLAILMLSATLALAACGKKGDLQPPTRSTGVEVQGR